MANKENLDFIYTTIDEIFRLSIGETGDFSGAFYNGDYSLPVSNWPLAFGAQIPPPLFYGRGIQASGGCFPDQSQQGLLGTGSDGSLPNGF